MEPIRRVTDIVRRKEAAEAGSAKRPRRTKTTGNPTVSKSNTTDPTSAATRAPVVSKSTAPIQGNHKPTFKLRGIKIPFLVGLIFILAEALFIFQAATEITSTSSALERFLGLALNKNTADTTPQEGSEILGLAMTGEIFSLPSSTSTATSTVEDLEPLEFSDVKPDLLPVVKLSSGPKSASAENKKSTPPTSAPKPSPPPTIITAKTLIDATTLRMEERFDGPYIASLETSAGTYGKLQWGLGQKELAVGSSRFTVSSSCDPPPEKPTPDAFDQSPLFEVKTAYTCTVGLVPVSGIDRQTQSKKFSFTTGPGQLVVQPQSSMITVLRDGSNSGGFIFRNDDSDSVTITDIYFDVSYKGLSTDSPMALRFENLANPSPFADYRLEDLAKDPATPHGHFASDVHISLNLPISGSDQKLLSVNALGIRKLGIYGVDPTITITLRKVIASPSANKVVLGSGKISWSCIVPIGAYDPSNPTGAYATGRACTQ